MNSRIISLLVLLCLSLGAPAQTMKDVIADGKEKNPFEKKFRVGAGFQMYWSKLTGDNLPVAYYAKPSLGISIRAEYYFTSFLGVGAGFGYQQRGTGVINADQSGGAFSHPWIIDNNGNQGDPDSTYLEKLRFNTLEFPVTLNLRTPKDVIKGVRLSGAAGVIYIYNIQANDVFQSVLDGLHKDNLVTDSYIRNDLGYQLSFGAEIDSGGTGTLFQLHFVYTEGLGNVYSVGQGNGHQIAYGLRFSCLF